MTVNFNDFQTLLTSKASAETVAEVITSEATLFTYLNKFAFEIRNTFGTDYHNYYRPHPLLLKIIALPFPLIPILKFLEKWRVFNPYINYLIYQQTPQLQHLVLTRIHTCDELIDFIDLVPGGHVEKLFEVLSAPECSQHLSDILKDDKDRMKLIAWMTDRAAVCTQITKLLKMLITQVPAFVETLPANASQIIQIIESRYKLHFDYFHNRYIKELPLMYLLDEYQHYLQLKQDNQNVSLTADEHEALLAKIKSSAESVVVLFKAAYPNYTDDNNRYAVLPAALHAYRAAEDFLTKSCCEIVVAVPQMHVSLPAEAQNVTSTQAENLILPAATSNQPSPSIPETDDFAPYIPTEEELREIETKTAAIPEYRPKNSKMAIDEDESDNVLRENLLSADSRLSSILKHIKPLSSKKMDSLQDIKNREFEFRFFEGLAITDVSVDGIDKDLSILLRDNYRLYCKTESIDTKTLATYAGDLDKLAKRLLAEKNKSKRFKIAICIELLINAIEIEQARADAQADAKKEIKLKAKIHTAMRKEKIEHNNSLDGIR